jgi:O-antigen/teichoic acid export membrane protein
MTGNLKQEAFHVVLGQALSSIIVFFQFLFLIRTLEQEDFGRLLLYLSTLALLYIVFVEPLSRAICRIKSEHKLINKRIITKYFSWVLFSSFLGSIFVFSSYIYIFIDKNLFNNTLMIVIILAFITSFNNVLLALINEDRDRGYVALVKVSESSFRLICVLCLLQFFVDIRFVLISYLAAAVVTFIMSYYRIMSNQGRSVIDKRLEDRHSVMGIATPLYGLAPFVWLRGSSDRWLIASAYSAEMLAQYGALVQIFFSPFTVLAGAAYSYISPILNQSFDANRTQQKRKLKFVKNFPKILFLTVALVLSLATLPFIGGFVLPEQYEHMGVYTPIVACAGVLSVLISGQEAKLLSEYKHWKIVIPRVLSALVSVLLFAFLPSKFDILGCFFALALSQLFYAVALQFTIQREA